MIPPLNITKTVVTAKSRQLSATWAFEEPHDVFSFIGDGVVEHLAFQIFKDQLPDWFFVDTGKAYNLSKKEDRKIKRWLKKNATGDYHYHHGEAVFEKKEDAALFMMIWYQQ